jgi:hypothetical protein
MTIQFSRLRARLLANPKVKAEYDVLAPEFETTVELPKPRTPGNDCPDLGSEITRRSGDHC